MSITVETASPCLDVPIAPAQPGGSPVIEIVIGSAIVRIAVGTDAATLQTVLRARRCRKLTACVISCGSCSRNSVGVRRSSIPSNARHMRRQCAPARIAFYLCDQTGQQVVRRNLNIQL